MVTRVEDNLRQMKANLMNWVLGALRWALFFQAHRDSSWKASLPDPRSEGEQSSVVGHH